MRRFLLRASVLGLCAVFSSSCILSRLTDRAFVGFTSMRPTYPDRKTTGMLLLPITFAIDLATFPIQLILLAIAGDDFIVGNDLEDGAVRPVPNYVQNLKHDPRFERLSAEQQAQAIAELEAMIQAGDVNRDTVLGLTDDGHWVRVELSGEARAQLLQRAKSAKHHDALAMCTP